MINIIFSIVLLFNVSTNEGGNFQSYHDREPVYCQVNVNPEFIDCFDGFNTIVEFNIDKIVDVSGEGYKDFWAGSTNQHDIYIIFDFDWLYYQSGEQLTGWIAYYPLGE